MCVYATAVHWFWSLSQAFASIESLVRIFFELSELKTNPMLGSQFYSKRKINIDCAFIKQSLKIYFTVKLKNAGRIWKCISNKFCVCFVVASFHFHCILKCRFRWINYIFACRGLAVSNQLSLHSSKLKPVKNAFDPFKEVNQQRISRIMNSNLHLGV